MRFEVTIEFNGSLKLPLSYNKIMEIIMEEPKKNQKIRMLSPVTVYLSLSNGITIYYKPHSYNFQRIVKENLLKKYKAFV